MNKILMSNSKANEIGAALRETLKAFGQAHGLTLVKGNGTYDPDLGTYGRRVQFIMTGQEDAAAQHRFGHVLGNYGLKVGTIVRDIRNVEYRVDGFGREKMKVSEVKGGKIWTGKPRAWFYTVGPMKDKRIISRFDLIESQGKARTANYSAPHPAWPLV